MYIDSILGQSDVITIKVSSLPMDTTTDEIGHYFESKGDNLKVLSAIDLGNGSAEVKIIGYSIEGQYIVYFQFAGLPKLYVNEVLDNRSARLLCIRNGMVALRHSHFSLSFFALAPW